MRSAVTKFWIERDNRYLCGRWRKGFEADRNTKPASYYRWWNEVPTVLMIAIVFLVVLKPF